VAVSTDVGKYKMRVDLSVLDSLGINLYSNAAAVLSELVANAYDADATEVSITWEQGQGVVVTDNGVGMNVDEMNDRFLFVGYKKRDSKNEGAESALWKRPYMGRKGIGKLSVFSIANTLTVYSTKDGETNGFTIDVDELREAIDARRDYEPVEVVEIPEEYRKQGTTLVLGSMRSKRADLSVRALRVRLARRFDVLDQTPADKGGFAIVVNGTPITYLDRQELKKLQFIWEFGESTLDDDVLPKGIERFVLSGDVKAGTDWKISGWIGTAKTPTDLTDDEEAGSLKNIIVLARKRPIQEGIVEKLDFSKVFGNYVTGQIEADFLDLNDEDDIATSDRQRLIEDDDRVVALVAFLRQAFNTAAQKWSDMRPKKEAPDALDRYPKIKAWIDTLDEYQKDYARTMVGTIAGLPFERDAEAQRLDLFRSGILAFARVGLRKATTDLEALSKVTAVDILPLLGVQADYEAGLWVDILRSRVEAISTFQEISDANEKEKVLQEHLFKNLWLLDASWERATGSERIEQGLRRMAKDEFGVDETKKEKIGRIDIRYATTGGKHVIVELKRYSVEADIDELKAQGGRYAHALERVLRKNGIQDPAVEVVFVLGEPPKVSLPMPGSPRAYIESSLDQINGRIVYYDELIGNALDQYDDYLKASEKAKDLDDLLSSISPPEPAKAASDERVGAAQAG
jgi:hypothetical protein